VAFWHFLLHILGVDNVSGEWYGFWSGIGGDLSIFGAVFVVLRKHNCHYRWCWRIGRFKTSDGTYVLCRKHHPDDSPTSEDILRAHASGMNDIPMEKPSE
jgi:hypothetical protein